MRSLVTATALVLGLAAAASGPAWAGGVGSDASGDTASAGGQTSAAEKHWGMLNKYCEKCHNYTDWKGQIAFDTMVPEEIPKDAKIWETAIGKLQGHLMPPPGKPQPDDATVDSFVNWLEGHLDKAAAENPQPGHVTLHRLNRTEYANEIKALFNLDIDVSDLLPADTKTDGFDNVAGSLQVSPTFLEQYIAAARKVTEKAIGDPKPTPIYDSIQKPEDVDFTQHVEGLPLGTRGGMYYDHYFPADGDYVFNINIASPDGYYLRSHWLESPNTLILTVDGDRKFEGHLGGKDDLKAVDTKLTEAVTKILDRFKNIHVKIPAGPHRIGIAWRSKDFAESDVDLEQYDPTKTAMSIPILRSFEFVGPYDPTGISQTPPRKAIFSCYPTSDDQDTACAKKILSRMAEKAFRRPVSDADMATLMRFYDTGTKEGGFEKGIQTGLMAMLSSPKFLYRAEVPPQNAKPGTIYRISDLALASRLSFFLWSQGPDQELIDLATRHKLSDPKVLHAQVMRMLADPKAEALVKNFAFQWLAIDDLDSVKPDSKIFPNFDEKLRTAFTKEMDLFLGSVLLQNKSVIDLLTADYTFVNERLARHYGIPSVRGGQWRKVTLTDPDRYGLLGKAAILMVSSYPNRTSLVLRGNYILDKIIGTTPPTMPMNVPPFPETQEGQKALTVRERMEQHRKDPACNFCHGVMDPLGIALENFDAIGEWRTTDRFAGTPIDSSGQMADGTPVSGPVALRNAILKNPNEFVESITKRLLMYGLGRTLDYHDMPVVRSIVRDAAKDDYKFWSLVEGVVDSDAFQKKTVLTAEGTTPTQEAAAK